MFKKILVIFIFIFLLLLCFFVFAGQYEEEVESGVLSIYFQDEKVGYEEYTWQSDEMGYLLSVKGRMTKPVDMEIYSLILRLDKSFIPRQFYRPRLMGGTIAAGVLDSPEKIARLVVGPNLMVSIFDQHVTWLTATAQIAKHQTIRSVIGNVNTPVFPTRRPVQLY